MPLQALPSMPGGQVPRVASLRVERIEPAAAVAGQGTTVYVECRCTVEARPVLASRIVIGGCSAPAAVYEATAKNELTTQAAQRELGLCAIVTIDRGLVPGEHEIEVALTFARGTSVLVATGSNLVVAPPTESDASATATRSTDSTTDGDLPLIAICMATHEPDPVLLQRQFDSIRQQSHERFICLISDDASSSAGWDAVQQAAGQDPRFVCTRSPERLGFYRNFERCLTQVPPDARFVALADQDDNWHPDKLAVLASALEESGALLAYSDVNIVSEEGKLLSPTYWVDRANNFTDLAALLMMNTVTGAASVFRRELLDDALPFPPELGRSFHDHWLAVTALAAGELAYVDRPLQDYVQHGENVAGTYVPSSDHRSGLLRAASRLVANPVRRTRNTMQNARGIFFDDVLRLEAVAKTLEVRLGSRMEATRAADVRRFANLSTSSASLGWLLARSARDLRGDGPSLGAENQLVKGIGWLRLQELRLRASRLRLSALT